MNDKPLIDRKASSSSSIWSLDKRVSPLSSNNTVGRVDSDMMNRLDSFIKTVSRETVAVSRPSL